MNALLLDIGNTRIKWRVMGAAAAEGLAAHKDDAGEPLATAQILPPLVQAWRAWLVTDVLVCSVSTEALTAEVMHAAQSLWPKAHVERVRSAARLAGMHNAYRDPEQLGTDRLLAAIGARTHVPQGALIVAMLGTATTIDRVSADNRFEGGAILAGARMMARALARDTAKLPALAESQRVIPDVGRDSVTAIEAGLVLAQAGAIERAVARAAADAPTLVLGGGAAARLAPYLAISYRLVDNLVLDGLAAVHHARTAS